jgi:hypothetical protein
MKTLSPEDIQKFPFVAKARKSQISDASYNVTSLSWIMEKFYPFYVKKLEELGVSVWDGKWDCEDFSSLFKNLAQVCHRKSKGTADGIAIGEVYYHQDNDNVGNHAINVIFTDGEPVFFEPQQGLPVKLSAKEMNSIYFFKI